MKPTPFLAIAFLLWAITVGGAQEPEKRPEKSTTQDSAKAVLDEKALEAEFAKELGAAQPTPAGQPSVQGTLGRSGASLNPRLSVVGSFLGSSTSENAVAKQNDVGLSEAEIAFDAYVDPYSKANFYVAFGHENEDPFAGPDTATAANGEFAADLEEAYLTTLSLPFSLQLKAGKFRSNFGKINSTHPHALNYIDLPRMYVNYFGEEGLADRGVSLSWLIPNPFDCYEELTLEVTSGALDGPSFSGESRKLLYLAHLKNFYDLDPNTTLEIGFSGMSGKNDDAAHTTTIGAADLTLKWKPLRMNRYKSFEWTTEALISKRATVEGDINSRALYSFVRYQIAKRWFVSARYDYSEHPDNKNAKEKAYAGVLSFFATEFQKLEIQFQHGLPAAGDSFNRFLLRAVFVIGAHGAHQY